MIKSFKKIYLYNKLSNIKENCSFYILIFSLNKTLTNTFNQSFSHFEIYRFKKQLIFKKHDLLNSYIGFRNSNLLFLVPHFYSAAKFNLYFDCIFSRYFDVKSDINITRYSFFFSLYYLNFLFKNDIFIINYSSLYSYSTFHFFIFFQSTNIFNFIII